MTGLEYSADVEAEVVGKPQTSFFSLALERLNSTLENEKLEAGGKNQFSLKLRNAHPIKNKSQLC